MTSPAALLRNASCRKRGAPSCSQKDCCSPSQIKIFPGGNDLDGLPMLPYFLFLVHGNNGSTFQAQFFCGYAKCPDFSLSGFFVLHIRANLHQLPASADTGTEKINLQTIFCLVIKYVLFIALERAKDHVFQVTSPILGKRKRNRGAKPVIHTVDLVFGAQE